ncbi:MAG: oligoendopeptidase F [Candidatus Eisenbacteria bacterium]|nr:oligoendopeptidase F [Candidatus Eisenbacteria bacterium]
MTRKARIIAASLALLLIVPTLAMAGKEARERADVDEQYKWDLSHIYATDADWEADYARLEAMLPEITGWEETYKGHLGESGEELLAFMKKNEELESLIERLYSYAVLKWHEDLRESAYQNYTQKVQMLLTQMAAATSWIQPELVAIPREKLQALLDNTEGLKIYQQSFDDMWRTQEHVLSEPEERILSLAGDVASVPADAYRQMTDADMKFGTFLDENGEEVEMTQARYMTYLQNPDRRVRRDAYRVYYDGYETYIHGTTSTYQGVVYRDLFYTRARNYGSCAERALDSDNVKVDVLENLINTINMNFAAVKKYNQIRKREMGLDTLYHWDYYVPIVSELDEEVPFEEAVATIQKGLKPLGKQYLKDMKAGFEGSWIDVYENAGKRSGAYSWGAYSLPHPYMLLNYENTLDDMFTVAHEMGHSLHTFYTSSNQPQVYGDYTIFVAEVASTTNEALLMHYLLEHEKDKRKRAYLIDHYIKQILGTVYTQVMFSEFEKVTHEMAERGEPLTQDALNAVYGELLNKYGGYEITYPEWAQIGWSRIPHFYRNFYVYKYATSYAAATAISRKILDGDKGALEAYLSFLKSGSSDYPVELLKKAGVDLSTPAPIEATCKLLGELVDELDRLLQES